MKCLHSFNIKQNLSVFDNISSGAAQLTTRMCWMKYNSKLSLHVCVMFIVRATNMVFYLYNGDV